MNQDPNFQEESNQTPDAETAVHEEAETTLLEGTEENTPASDETSAPSEKEVSAPTEEALSLPAEEQKSPMIITAFEILEMFAWSVFVVLLLFTFGLRLTRVDGSSMENTLYDGQKLIVSSFAYTPKQDDIIVFHMTKPDKGLEKAMVKRVIATGGQKLRIDFKAKEITVDGVPYEDSHRILKNFNGATIDYYSLRADHYYDMKQEVFEATIPEGTLFVMGDNRNNSKDSRNSDVGFVDERSVLGKVVFRVFPFDFFA